jgi:hypothetical protein
VVFIAVYINSNRPEVYIKAHKIATPVYINAHKIATTV